MKRDWEKVFESDVSDQARDRIFAAADNLIDELQEKKQKASLWDRLFSWQGGLALAGAAAVALVVAVEMPKGEKPAHQAALDPDLIRNVDLLLELDTLEKWDPSQAKKVKAEWQKRKS